MRSEVEPKTRRAMVSSSDIGFFTNRPRGVSNTDQVKGSHSVMMCFAHDPWRSRCNVPLKAKALTSCGIVSWLPLPRMIRRATRFGTKYCCGCWPKKNKTTASIDSRPLLTHERAAPLRIMCEAQSAALLFPLQGAALLSGQAGIGLREFDG